MERTTTVYRIDRYDVRMLQLSQGTRFHRLFRGYFDRYGTASQVALFCQKHTAKGAATQFTHQLEIEKARSALRHDRSRLSQPTSSFRIRLMQFPEKVGGVTL